MPYLSIVLPSYNRLYSLRDIFLAGLAAQDYEDYELIVVDDCSTDGTGAYLTKEGLATDYPEIARRLTYSPNSENVGAPGSRNRGAALARGEWIYIVEDDVEISDPRFLSKAAGIMRAQPADVAVICPKRAESVRTGYYRNPPGQFARIGRLSGEIYIDPDQEYTGYAESAQASSFIRRDIFLEFKEDEELFFGNTFRDESDLYLRINRAGYRILYCGDTLKTVHRNDIAVTGGQKKVNGSSLIRQEGMLLHNHYLYLKKHYSCPALRLAAFAIVRGCKVASRIIRCDSIKNVCSAVRL